MMICDLCKKETKLLTGINKLNVCVDCIPDAMDKAFMPIKQINGGV